MSETVRNYSWGGNSSKRRRLWRKRGTGLAKLLFPVLLLALVWVAWITRDKYEMISFISRDRAFEVYINNIIERRQDIIRSTVWRLLPSDSPARGLLDTLAEDMPIPEWLLNNLNSGLCYIAGPEIQNFDEVLVITRMTRIGCLAERTARLLPAVQEDNAGGLFLHHVPDAGLYYAVRGRTFLATTSRDRLIQALTIPVKDTLGADEFDKGIQMAGGADIYCRVMPDSLPALATPFKDVSFAARFEAESARLVFQADFSSAFLEQYADLFPKKTAERLPAPFDAIASVSLDLGQPLPDFMNALEKSFGESNIIPDWFWSGVRVQNEDGMITSLQPLIASTIQTSGAQIRLGWFGMDSLEMVPVPLVAAAFDADSDKTLFLFENIPSAPQTAQEEIDLFPRLDPELMLAHAPFVGGPNMEPTLAQFRDGIILSSSLPLARELTKSGKVLENFDQRGNLYIGIKPTEASQALAEATRELAASGLLRGYARDNIESTLQTWINAASGISEAVLLASWDGGKLHTEFRISMCQTQPAAQSGANANNPVEAE